MSLRTRLLAAFAYVLVLVIVALEVPLALNLSRRVDAEIKSEAQGQAQLIAAAASGRLGNREELQALVDDAELDLGGRVIVVDSSGRLVADSAGTGLRDSSYASRPEVAAALAGRTTQGTRHSDSLDEDLLFTSVPVLRDGRRAGAVRVTQSVENVNTEVRNDVIALVGVGLAALLLGLGVAWLLANSLAQPLKRLAGAARRVAGGDLDARAREEGSAEQREVAGAFNDMTDRLGRALRAQQDFVANASHQLRTPLTGLRLRLEAAALKSGDPAVERELAAAERPPAEELDLADVVRAATERWEAPAERSDHRLEARGQGEAVVASSRQDLDAILDNLIENALNYSPEGTAVTVEWGSAADIARVAVLDEGPGIKEEEDGRVFERFFRGSAGSGAPGTGLGLSVVEALAHRWGGEASLTNRPEGGARAEVRLPSRGGQPGALPTLDRPLDEALPKRG